MRNHTWCTRGKHSATWCAIEDDLCTGTYAKRKGYSMLAIFTHLVEVQNHVVDTVLLGDVEVKCHNSTGLVRHIDACCDGSVASALHRSAKET